jgi:hypothetical protein
VVIGEKQGGKDSQLRRGREGGVRTISPTPVLRETEREGECEGERE